jgi:hypothetical protein
VANIEHLPRIYSFPIRGLQRGLVNVVFVSRHAHFLPLVPPYVIATPDSEAPFLFPAKKAASAEKELVFTTTSSAVMD